MSAWIVSDEHIHQMVLAAHSCDLRWQRRYTPPDGLGWRDAEYADRVGQMLRDENVSSIEHRYPSTRETGDYPGPVGFDPDEPYVFKYLAYRMVSRGPLVISPAPPRRTVVEILKAIGCYEYQSCEHPEWPDSEAKAFCEALRSAMIRKLPGYKDAPWGID